MLLWGAMQQAWSETGREASECVGMWPCPEVCWPVKSMIGGLPALIRVKAFPIMKNRWDVITELTLDIARPSVAGLSLDSKQPFFGC